MGHLQRLHLVGLALVGAGAQMMSASAQTPNTVPKGTSGVVVPSLTRVRFANGLDTLIWETGQQIAVSRSGRIAVLGDLGADPAKKTVLHIIDRSAKQFISVGLQGQGPGELTGSDIIFARGDTFDLFNLRRLVMIHYAADGKFLREERPVLGAGIPLQVVGDSIDVMSQRWPTSGTQTLVSRLPRIGTAPRSLLATTDSFALAAIQHPDVAGRTRGMPAFASTASLVALAEPRSYRINVYDRTGRLSYSIQRKIQPKRRNPSELLEMRKSIEYLAEQSKGQPDRVKALKARLDTLGRESIPHFGYGGMHFDDAGRLWVIGTTGDSTFVDVFAKERFLRRTVLGCRNPQRRIALQGEWLALLCDFPAREAAPFELQLYRIDAKPGTPR